MQVWALPNAVASLPDPRIPGKSAPRFAVQVATYDEASGATVTAPVHSYGWATTVQFAVKRVPLLAGSPATATSYEIVGASGADIELLERIVDQIGDDEAAFAPLLLAYPPDATTAAPSGLQTDPPDTVTMGIAQVNLSTETRPSAFRVSAETPDDRPAGLLNTKPAFIRLLWEASITRNGGFYLYYYDAADGRGLPDRIFNDRGEAHVWLVVLYANPGTEAAGNRVQDYMTSIVTGDSIDTSRSVIVAAAAPMEAPVPAAGDLTLSLLAARTYSDLADLAEANQALALATGVRLTIEHGLYQAPPGGISLAAIVAAFGLGGVAELNAANPRWTGGLPDPLSYPVAINLPVLTVTAERARAPRHSPTSRATTAPGPTSWRRRTPTCRGSSRPGSRSRSPAARTSATPPSRRVPRPSSPAAQSRTRCRLSRGTTTPGSSWKTPSACSATRSPGTCTSPPATWACRPA